jgi:hypothetical protein
MTASDSDSFDPEQFFKAVGIDASALSAQERQKIAVKFLSFFMLKVLHDIPQVREKLDDYFQEFQQLEKKQLGEKSVW